MDNPLALMGLVFCLGPLLFFGLGFWVARGLPGLPIAFRIERRYSGGSHDWEP